MKDWSSYGNSYLRYLESAHKENNSMTIFTQSALELQSALQDLTEYVIRMSSGKAKISIQAGEINISIENSKEMFT